MGNSFEQEMAIAEAEIRAAKARKEAALLKATAEQKGCREPVCPGPRMSRDGGCPMGWAGSCRRLKR